VGYLRPEEILGKKRGGSKEFSRKKGSCEKKKTRGGVLCDIASREGGERLLPPPTGTGKRGGANRGEFLGGKEDKEKRI